MNVWRGLKITSHTGHTMYLLMVFHHNKQNVSVKLDKGQFFDQFRSLHSNDLPNVVSGRTNVSMYADDTALYTVCNDVNDLNRTLNTNLKCF